MEAEVYRRGDNTCREDGVGELEKRIGAAMEAFVEGGSGGRRQDRRKVS